LPKDFVAILIVAVVVVVVVVAVIFVAFLRFLFFHVAGKTKRFSRFVKQHLFVRGKLVYCCHTHAGLLVMGRQALTATQPCSSVLRR
jgi:hypothetical protein